MKVDAVLISLLARKMAVVLAFLHGRLLHWQEGGDCENCGYPYPCSWEATSAHHTIMQAVALAVARGNTCVCAAWLCKGGECSPKRWS